MNMTPFFRRCYLIGALFVLTLSAHATTYYLDADGGSDLNTGTSPAQAWRTLAHVNTRTFLPGDQILLQKGDTFPGKILIDGNSGAEGNPIIIASYGEGSKPVINASGYIAGVHIRDAEHVEVSDLEITANGGVMVDGSPETERYGVYANATTGNAVRHVSFRNLHIHDIFPSAGKPSEGANPTTHFGYGVFLSGQSDGQSAHFLIENCTIERTGHRGIHLLRVNFASVIDNVMTDIGGPAIQPSRCDDVVVRGNVVTRSGSYVDTRMHGRGSGIWPWTCQRVLIEKNTFSGARGRGDSCGIHIDFNCSHVVVQYNLSINNSGGFIEILGNGYNNTYRYNISINDGSRVKGVLDQGTIHNEQDGNILWTSGYVGNSQDNVGPFNSYFYNNTIYIGSGTRRAFHFQENTRGLLIANNIFYVVSDTFDGTTSGLKDYTQDMINSVVWDNNLYQRTGIIPTSFPFRENPQTIGDPLFANAGGLAAADYIPAATALIMDQGMVIEKLPGDALGLEVGLAVTEDFFGNPIIGLPDLGAVEIAIEMPDAAFSQVPAATSASSVSMISVVGPSGTEYYFEETSGNFGGSDSGWQPGNTYTNFGLLPNTSYRYRVTLRDVAAVEGAPSAAASVTTPAIQPFQNPTLFVENFSAVADPSNRTSPFPAETWYALNEAESSSVAISNGKLRTGWGYDAVTTLYRTAIDWNLSQAYRLRGDWFIENVLDVHQGIQVGIGEFNATTGALIRRVKQVTVGNLSNPVIGESGAIQLDLSVAEIAAAGLIASSRMGIFIDHLGATTPNRNDVYLVDNFRLELNSANADSDGDGIPDSEENLLGMDSLDPADGALDSDGDGFTNAQEYRMGTDPDDGAGFLRKVVESNGGQFSIRLAEADVLAGRWYIFETSSDLQNWTVANGVRGADVVGDLIFDLPTGTQGFARVRVEWSE
jgi:hypothetical protein